MHKEIDVKELARWRSEGKAFVLLDVREPREWATAALPDALQISMREIALRISELPKDAKIAVICHLGGRSERVAQFLTTQGYADVSNVGGGIDAYAREIDAAIPLY